MPVIPQLRHLSASDIFTPRSLAPDGATLSNRVSLPLNIWNRLAPSSQSVGDSSHALSSRAITGIIPTYYHIDGPPPGTLVGIVLGAVAGFLFLVWLIFVVSDVPSWIFAGEQEIVVRRERSSRSPRSPRSRRSRRSTRDFEVRELSRSPGRERVIIEERRGSRGSRSSIPTSSRRSRSIIVEERRERRVPGDDIVEVIEGSDITPPPRRQRSRRGNGYGY